MDQVIKMDSISNVFKLSFTSVSLGMHKRSSHTSQPLLSLIVINYFSYIFHFMHFCWTDDSIVSACTLFFWSKLVCLLFIGFRVSLTYFK